MLTERWEALKRAVAARGKLLEDNRDFLEFLQKVEQVEVWIRQKVIHRSFICIARFTEARSHKDALQRNRKGKNTCSKLQDIT